MLAGRQTLFENRKKAVQNGKKSVTFVEKASGMDEKKGCLRSF